MSLKFVRTTQDHIDDLLKNIHPDIKNEVECLSSLPYEESIKRTIGASEESWTIQSDDGVLGIFGINKSHILSDKGIPWLLTTFKIKNHIKTLLPLTKIALNYWLKQYSILENYIPISYKATVRWLKWAGFTITDKPCLIGVNGGFIHKVEMRK